MNKTSLSILFLAPLTVAGAAIAASRHAERVEALPPVKVQMPIVGDTALAPHRFSDVQLLEGASRRHVKTTRSQIETTDTAGYFKLSKPASGRVVETLVTTLRPERFIKGSLKVTSASVFEVMVDGVSKGSKAKPDSAITASSVVAVPIELEPERTADIMVKVLTDSEAKNDPTVKIEFEPESKYSDVNYSLVPEKKHRFSIYDMSDGPRARSTSMSPDGKYVITRFVEVFSEKEQRTWSTLTETKTGKIINAGLNGSAGWMPSGSTLYYTVKRGDSYDLVNISLPSQSSETVATGLPTGDIIWSPDASYFVYYKSVPGTRKEGIMQRYSSPDDRMPENRDRYYLMKYDLSTSVAQPLTYGGATTYPDGFNADGSKMLIKAMRENTSEYPFYKTDLIQVDMKTMAVDTLVKANGDLSSAVYSPDGKSLFIVGGPSLFGKLGVNAGDHPIANDFDSQGYLFDIASKKVTPMTRDFDPAIQGEPVWNAADGKIYFRAEEGFFVPVYCLNPADGSIKKLPVAADNVANFSIGNREDRYMSYTGQAYEYAGRAYLMDLKTGKSTVMADPDAERLAEVNFGKTQPWRFTASDGTEIDGMMCLPPDFDPNKKYPLIVYYYGGTSPSQRGMSHAYIPQLFASRDYVVYILNPSGTTGYGQEFSARHVNAWGKRTADEIIEGVKKFCEEHPYVDSKKIGCLGASYGGFMTMYLQTLTDIFSAAVSHAGISNVTSYWGEGYWGYSYNSVAAAKSYPWNNPDLFTKQGALFNADKIHTPLLLLHGTEDTNVPIGESIQLFNALKVLGRDVEFITVEGANHVVKEYDKRIVWHATIMAWFAKWLQDDSRWWDSMYGDK